MKQSFDLKLSEKWNNVHNYSKTAPEQFWDVCRILSTNKNKYLISDQGAVSAISIGPFNIATSIDITQKDFLVFFAESIFPALITEIKELSFEEAYPLYLVPAFKILTYILEHSFFIQDPLQWEILIYIKTSNEIERFPTIPEIINEFIKLNDSKTINDAIHSLLNIENNFGTKSAVIFIDTNNGIHSLV